MKKLLLLAPLTGLLLIACQKEKVKEYPIDPTLKEWRIAYEDSAMLRPGTYPVTGAKVVFSVKAGETVYSDGSLWYGVGTNSKIYVNVCQQQTRRDCGFVMYTNLSGFDLGKPGGGK